MDVRVLAATNRNLNDLVTTGQSHEDFLDRLRVIHLHVPPLRERPEDVHVLMREFFARSGRDLRFTDGALRAFVRYSWPGNVRELPNVVEQLVWLSAGGVVGVQHLPFPMRSGPGVMAVDDPGQVADELYDALARQGASFWEHVYPMFLAHDITRDDLRELVRRGLRESQGRYKALLTLFGMPSRDYRRFMNFLAEHECAVARHEFRAPRASDAEVGMAGSVLRDDGLGRRTRTASDITSSLAPTLRTSIRMNDVLSYVYAEADAQRGREGGSGREALCGGPRYLRLAACRAVSRPTCPSRPTPMIRSRFCVCSGEWPAGCPPMDTAGISAGNTGEASPAAF